MPSPGVAVVVVAMALLAGQVHVSAMSMGVIHAMQVAGGIQGYAKALNSAVHWPARGDKQQRSKETRAAAPNKEADNTAANAGLEPAVYAAVFTVTQADMDLYPAGLRKAQPLEKFFSAFPCQFYAGKVAIIEVSKSLLGSKKVSGSRVYSVTAALNHAISAQASNRQPADLYYSDGAAGPLVREVPTGAADLHVHLAVKAEHYEDIMRVIESLAKSKANTNTGLGKFQPGGHKLLLPKGAKLPKQTVW